MAGSKEGSLKAKEKVIQLYGEDFYRRIGSIGGKRGTGNKGFALMTRAKRVAAGKKGGARSRRGKVED